MADLTTQTAHTLTLTGPELASVRRGLIVAEAATKDDPKARRDRTIWTRIADTLNTTPTDPAEGDAPPPPRPTMWGTGGRTHAPRPTPRG